VGHAEGRAEHAQRGAALAGEILCGSGFPVDKVAAVITCIEHHHWMPGRVGDPSRPTPEYEAFADADRLDALGAIGIARAFAFGGAHDRPIWNPDPTPGASGPYGASSIHHFYEKLLRLPGDMYTDVGRHLAARRVAVMEEFLRTFYAEWDGRDVDAVRLGDGANSLNTFSEGSIEVGDRIGRRSSTTLQPNPIN
jgi:HD superfamily phosphodiesterase